MIANYVPGTSDWVLDLRPQIGYNKGTMYDHLTDSETPLCNVPYIGKAIPRPYQRVGINWLRTVKRGLLRDRPGLGKTIQAAYAAHPPVIIFCPNHLVEQWVEWLKGEDQVSLERNYGRVIPNVEGAITHVKGNFYQKLKLLQSDAEWMVANVEVLQTHKEELAHMSWRTVVFDESQYVRNHQSQRGRTAVKLAQEAEYVYLLTATPIWKEPDDLYNQFRIMQPDVFQSYYKFVQLFCVADMTQYGIKVLGVKRDMQDELEEILNTMSIGRKASDVGRQLPSQIDNFVKIEFPKDLQDIYQQTVDDWIAEFGPDLETIRFENFSQVLNSLRLLTRFPGKYEAMQEVVEAGLKQGRVLVIGWYRDTVETAKPYLDKLAKSIVITGEVKAVERRHLIDDLSNRIIAANYSLTEGVDLSDVRTVVFLEEHYTPGANDQILSRVVRERVRGYAQGDEPVNVFYIQVKGTIDEIVHRKARTRGTTIKELIWEGLGLA